ncbi:hypothetical protein [Agromyces soli]|uniref:DUF2076 domain-containing protein n=1 Tax=Agromyces soli TaxID=659012 RepID=A0ABY4AQ57_9MICO|nr:hypothetical protein [Agromyces soli]UOE25258.1 hypothetical protein MTP13_12995 [Agromyces soli]
MGFFDRLFGAPEERPAAQPAPRARALSEDELAVERYRYLLRTAPPESIEQVHAEAFAKLTPEQRQQVFQALSEQAPAGERLVSDEPSALARAATRQELRAPGSMERAFQGGGRGGAAAGGPSFGQMLGGSMLGTIAGVVVGSAIAQAFLPGPGAFEAGGGEGSAEQGGDAGSVDAAGADQGGDGGFGDGGFGDFGGGDFGGGDFGF